MTTHTCIPDHRYPDCTLTAYLHDPSAELAHPPRRAIIVCPGGGYFALSDREGEPIALAYFAAGLQVFLLRYSILDRATDHVPLIEGALAVKHIREHAVEYGVDPAYVFMTGFSAGGHLAAMCGTLWHSPIVEAAIGAEGSGMPAEIHRPTATVLCYPVISAYSGGYSISIENLCGGAAYMSERQDAFSLELHVDKTTSPAFIWHTSDDDSTPVKHSLLYAAALAANGVPFELHIYPHGPHGLSLATKETSCGHKALINPVCAGWLKEAIRYVLEFEAS